MKEITRFLLTIFVLTWLSAAAVAQPARHWWEQGRQTAERLAGKDPGHEAKNLILFVGDGMGLSTINAARIYDGQLRGSRGEENLLFFESFPHLALVKTYSTDKQVSDSSSTMTAIVTGSKTKSGYVSVSEEADFSQCSSDRSPHVLPSLLERFEELGVATGIVTTTRITHATPAATYAHIANRGMESDARFTADLRDHGCRDIARQFVEFSIGDGPEVTLGGGRAQFLPSNVRDPEHIGVKGARRDGRNLIAEWENQGENALFIWNLLQFNAIDSGKVGRLLGLFEPSHMNYEADRRGDVAGEPSLAEMTELAIEILQRHDSGYFLMVEGGRIDHAHHASNAQRALRDALAFDEAVRLAAGKVSDETLIVVTADHDHPLTIVGYPDRGNPILGKVTENKAGRNRYSEDLTGLPYTTLVYGSGPGYSRLAQGWSSGRSGRTGRRADISEVDTMNVEYLQETALPFGSGTHAGTDVVAYARGPGAHFFRGVVEQNALYFLMERSMQHFSEGGSSLPETEAE